MASMRSYKKTSSRSCVVPRAQRQPESTFNRSAAVLLGATAAVLLSQAPVDASTFVKEKEDARQLYKDTRSSLEKLFEESQQQASKQVSIAAACNAYLQPWQGLETCLGREIFTRGSQNVTCVTCAADVIVAPVCACLVARPFAGFRAILSQSFDSEAPSGRNSIEQQASLAHLPQVMFILLAQSLERGTCRQKSAHSLQTVPVQVNIWCHNTLARIAPSEPAPWHMPIAMPSIDA